MRSSFLLMAVCSSLLVKANVLTVSNDPAKPAQFTSVSAAFSAAAAGDTLYIYGSQNIYGDLTINKSITIIGIGLNARKESFNHSNLNDIFLSNNVSNVTIDGFAFRRFLPMANTVFTYTNITVRNCLIYQDLGLYNPPSIPVCGGVLTNWVFQNCYFRNFVLSSNSGCSPVSPSISGLLLTNCHITLFQFTQNARLVNCQIGNEVDGTTFSNNKNCVFENCIFQRISFNQDNGNINNVFHNCLTYQTQSPNINFDLNNWTGGATGSATGCIINQNPLFVNGNPLRDLLQGIGIPVRWDPSLQPGSPAINAGTDGTNIGINGGPTPYLISGEPNIPVVRKFQLTNPVVPSNGTVTLKATATKAQ